MSFFGKIGDFASGALNVGTGGLWNKVTGADAVKTQKDALKLWDKVSPPDLQELQLALQGQSNLRNIQSDPALRSAQMGALRNLDVLSQPGLTPSDIAQIKSQQSIVNQNEKAQRDAILQNAQARGVSSGGNALVAQMLGLQGATNRLNQAGTDVLAGATNRQLAATGQIGNIAGSVANQDWQQAAEKARAMDLINQYNTGLINQQRIYNTQSLPQQKFLNQMQLTGSKTGQYNQIAQGQLSAGDRIASIVGGVVKGAAA